MGEVETAGWLAQEYPSAYRAAWLLLDGRGPVDEVVSGAFGRAWRFRRSLGEGPAMRPWLYRIVVSGCAAVISTGPAIDPALDPGPVTPLTGPADFDRAWTALPPTLRAPVVLCHLVGLSERETALALGRRSSLVRSRLAEARRALAPIGAAAAPADRCGEVRP